MLDNTKKSDSVPAEKEDFANITGYLRVMEKRILSNDSLGKIIGVPGFDEAVRQLAQATEYDFAALKQPEDYEEALFDGLKAVYDTMRKRCGEPLVSDIPAAKYDFHNIKVALKSKFLGIAHERLYSRVTEITPEEIERGVHSAVQLNLPAHLAEACAAGAEAFEKSGNPQDIDITLDRLMFAHMLKLSAALGNEFITEYTRLSVEFYNIKTFLRAESMKKDAEFLRNSLVDGGYSDVSLIAECHGKSAAAIIPAVMGAGFFDKYFGERFRQAVDKFSQTGNYAAAEKFLDNELVRHLKRSKLVAFGPEIVFSYILSKENELRQIRILLTCKLNGIHDDVLTERLRDNYA